MREQEPSNEFLLTVILSSAPFSNVFHKQRPPRTCQTFWSLQQTRYITNKVLLKKQTNKEKKITNY